MTSPAKLEFKGWVANTPAIEKSLVGPSETRKSFLPTTSIVLKYRLAASSEINILFLILKSDVTPRNI
jgi:hypothetical protein